MSRGDAERLSSNEEDAMRRTVELICKSDIGLPDEYVLFDLGPFSSRLMASLSRPDRTLQAFADRAFALLTLIHPDYFDGPEKNPTKIFNYGFTPDISQHARLQALQGLEELLKSRGLDPKLAHNPDLTETDAEFGDLRLEPQWF